MAVVRILSRIHTTLDKALNYIEKNEKTNNGLYISSYACASDVQGATHDFLVTREQLGTGLGKVLARHAVQSFAPGEITPEQAHQIGKQLCDEFLQGDFQYVITTDIEKEHIHNHIIFSNTNLRTGYCFRDEKGYKNSALTKLRKISDHLCEENGLSVIDNDYEKYQMLYGKKFKARSKSWYEYLEETNDPRLNVSWKNKLQKCVDKNILKAKSWNDFLSLMQEDGYETKWQKPNGQSYEHIAFKHIKQKRWTRADKKLGDDYTEEKLRARILEAENIKISKLEELEKQNKIEAENSFKKRIGYVVDKHKGKFKDNAALQSWATSNNIHTIANTLNQLETLGYKNGNLDKFIQTKVSFHQSILDKIKVIENEQDKLGKTMDLLHKLKVNKEVYDESLKTTDKQFNSTYRTEIALYKLAERQLKELYPDKIIPSTKAIMERLEVLDQQDIELLNQYSQSKDTLQELEQLKRNYDLFMERENKHELIK